MKWAPHFTLTLPLRAVLAGCGGSGSAPPTAPSETVAASPAPAPPPPREQSVPINGDIRLMAVNPAPGASLPVRDCLAGQVTRSYATDWTATFELTSDRHIRWAVLSIGFYDGGRLCAYAADVVLTVTPGETATFRPSRIFLSDEFGTFSAPCALPARTTTMVAHLWTDDDWSISLTREFAGGYTFLKP